MSENAVFNLIYIKFFGSFGVMILRILASGVAMGITTFGKAVINEWSVHEHADGVPLPLLVSQELMQYQSMLGFIQHWLGKIIVFSIIVLFLWHAALRILNMLHDFGIHAGTGARFFCYVKTGSDDNTS